MIGMFSIRRLVVPVIACAALSFIACGGGGDDDDDDDSPAASGRNDFFRVTKMEVGSESEGVDLDGDGSVDNNIEVALGAATSAMYTAIESALINNGVPFGDECSPDSGTVCGDSIMEAVAQILDGVLSVDSLSTAINTPIEEGNLNYIMRFVDEGANTNLYWYTAAFVSTGFNVSDDLGRQDGSIVNGSGAFGPGNLTLSLVFETPETGQGGGDTIEAELVLYNGRTDVSSYNSSQLNDVATGGAISTEDLVALVEQVIRNINEAIPTHPLTEQQILDIVDGVSEALSGYADIDINGDGTLEGFSIGLILNASAVEIENADSL